ncbi:MAG: dienelactone hydrolase, partial [Bdellovibrio sp.]
MNIKTTKSRHFDLRTADGICDCFVAYPEGQHPAVLFYMDGFGPRPWLFQMVKKLASHGYFVFLPNSFYRIKRAPMVNLPFPLKVEDLPKARETLMSLVRSFNHQDAMRDAGAYLDFLAKQPEVRPGPAW